MRTNAGAIAHDAGPLERQLITGGHDGKLSMWDLDRPQEPLATMMAHEGIVNGIDGAGSKVSEHHVFRPCPFPST